MPMIQPHLTASGYASSGASTPHPSSAQQMRLDSIATSAAVRPTVPILVQPDFVFMENKLYFGSLRLPFAVNSTVPLTPSKLRLCSSAVIAAPFRRWECGRALITIAMAITASTVSGPNLEIVLLVGSPIDVS